MKLHLGVLDVPYGEPGSNSAIRTGEVAEILEAHYGVMSHFITAYEDKICAALEESVGDAIDDLIGGAPTGLKPFAAAESRIASDFRQFLATQEAERVGMEGVPTQAALMGVNHRKKHPYAKSNPRRPSFIDTGLYSASFRAWFEP